MSFRTIFGKFEKSTEDLGKMILVEKYFLRTVGKLSVNVRNIFVLPLNKLFINWIARAAP